MSTTTTTLNFANIQGDIILGLPKKVQQFVFFQITNVSRFRKQLQAVVPFVTTMAKVMNDRAKIASNKKEAAAKGVDSELVQLPGTNIAFSHAGLIKMNVTQKLGDDLFEKGQVADAPFLADKGSVDSSGTFVPDWDETFKQQLDGVFLLTGETDLTLTIRRVALDTILLGSIKVVDVLHGNVRPGAEKGHEHFGFKDGVSQPPINGFTQSNDGQKPIPAGVILLGNEGDSVDRSPIAKDGSFLAFRKLKQYVPEFDDFLLKNGTAFDGLTPKEGADFLGSRLMGRWKSGAPNNIAPLKDDPILANDPARNNNFHFTFLNPDDQKDQTRCPFSAHIRKTNPRGDLDNFGGVDPNRIIRQGIPYGPEVAKNEREGKKTKNERGLAFVAYQSVIANGFHLIQQTWANNPGFPIGKNVPIGFDPIVGQNGNGDRTVAGFDPKDQQNALPLPMEFVESRGGEYFFSPSIATLRNVIATK